MGLFSSGQNKQDTAEDSGHYVARDEADLAATARSKRASNAGENGRRKKAEAPDPILPEKKRARRRLVGAIALALAVAVGLPMILDSEPKPVAADITIQIPQKDKVAPLPAPAPAPAASAGVPASTALDAKEEIVDPAAVAKDKPADAHAVKTVEAKPAEGKAAEAAVPAVKPDVKAAEAKHETRHETKPADGKTAAKPADAAKAAGKADAKPAKAADDARALAILEGRTPPEKPKADAAAQKIVMQVGAFAAAEKVTEVQGKLAAAGIKSYTEKHGDTTRVRVGPFATKAEADQAQAKLEKLGLKGKIVTN